MSNRLFDYYFWFAQPPTILDSIDKNFLYFFAGLLGLAVIFGLVTWFSKNPVNKTLFRKFWRLTIWTALAGLVWFGVRYENTQIFGRRYWAGLTLLIGFIWLMFILKYLIFNYRSQKIEYDREMIKNKYLPKAR